MRSDEQLIAERINQVRVHIFIKLLNRNKNIDPWSHCNLPMKLLPHRLLLFVSVLGEILPQAKCGGASLRQCA